MPTYEYRCKSCLHEFEELQKFSDEPLTRCPSCHKDSLVRMIGGGAGLMFKGSGFYLTDYKKGSASASSDRKSTSKEPKQDRKQDQRQGEKHDQKHDQKQDLKHDQKHDQKQDEKHDQKHHDKQEPKSETKPSEPKEKQSGGDKPSSSKDSSES
jgi:putative FmdB family regulatory protein